MAPSIRKPGTSIWLCWLGRVRAAIEALGDHSRVTIGGYGPASSVALIQPLCDVLTVHPYFAWSIFCKTAEDFRARADELAALAEWHQDGWATKGVAS